MKKIILVAIGLVLSFNMGYSQIKSKPGVGLSISDFSESNSSTKGKAGLQIGGSFIFGDKFYFEPGIFYATKSTEFIYSEGNTEINGDAVIRGIRVPVGVGFNFLGDDTQDFNFRAFGGGSAFFVTGTGDDLNEDNIEKTNFGTYLGIGVDIWKLFVDVSYEWSLTDVLKDSNLVDLGKHRTVFLTVGFKLHYGK